MTQGARPGNLQTTNHRPRTLQAQKPDVRKPGFPSPTSRNAPLLELPSWPTQVSCNGHDEFQVPTSSLLPLSFPSYLLHCSSSICLQVSGLTTPLAWAEFPPSAVFSTSHMAAVVPYQ